MSRKCKNDPDKFCYICGEITFVSQRRNLTPLIKKLYESYFGFPVRQQDKVWVPHICCVTCVGLLTGWEKRSRSMPFGIPMIWMEPINHSTNCYFCLTNTKGFTIKTKKQVKYPDVSSAKKPIPHSEKLPIPKPPQRSDLSTESEETDNKSTDPDFQIASSSIYLKEERPHLLSQGDLNDLVRDLRLSQQQGELLGSLLKGWNLLQPNTKITFFRHRDEELKSFYLQDNDLIFCNNVCGVMNILGIRYKIEEWRLFIDASKTSLKTVLLHNGNNLPSVPVGYGANMKESYETMKFLLEKIQNDEHKWNICGD